MVISTSQGSAFSMKIERLGLCRGEGLVYAKLRITGGLGGAVLKGANSYIATGRVCGNEVPVDVYPLNSKEDTWVLVFPNLDAPSITVRISCADDLTVYAFISFSYFWAKWQSRINYRFRHSLCCEIRDFQRNFTAGKYQLEALQRFDAGCRGVVWRVAVSWDGHPSCEPSLRCLHSEGSPLDAVVHRFELQSTAVDDLVRNKAFYSVATEKDVSNFVLLAEDSLGKVVAGFAAVDRSMAAHLKAEAARCMADAHSCGELYHLLAHERKVLTMNEAFPGAKSLNGLPLFSVIVPCFNSNERFLREMVGSVLGQTYENWELLLIDASVETGAVSRLIKDVNDERIRYVPLATNGGIVVNTNAGIKRAKGDFVAFLDHDDILEPDALCHYASEIAKNNEVQVLYCDEEVFESSERRGQPDFKSDLNVDLLYSHNYITHFLAIRADLLNRIGLSSEDVSGAQDYDLVLRAFCAGAKFVHVPHVLYRWRMHPNSTSGGNVDSKPYAEEAGRLALERHFESRGIVGKVEMTNEPFVYRVRYSIPEPQPLLSIIIPSKDNADLLEGCVCSIVEKSTYENYEILIVENNSSDPMTAFRYAQIEETYNGVVRVVRWGGTFNYSEIVNFGVSEARGEYLLLLNNDTAVISPDFIEEMMGYLQRPEVGVVGAKLFFRDGLTQHSGIVVGPYDAAVHVNQNFPDERPGYLGRAVRPGNFSAVTGACQMMRRSVFDQVGGYDDLFAVGFNDIDFCLRVGRAGYLTTFTPYAKLYHYEFATRGRETADSAKYERWKREQALFLARWAEVFVEGDPFSNPNLAKNNAYFGMVDI